MEGDPKHIFEINFYQSNDKPHWNPTIKEYKVRSVICFFHSTGQSDYRIVLS